MRTTRSGSAALLLLLGTIAGGCDLLGLPVATYQQGSAHASFTWTEGSPPPRVAAIPAVFLFREGNFEPDSSEEVDRGAGAVFDASDGSRLFVEGFSEDPRSGHVALWVGGTEDPDSWVVSGSVPRGCVRELESTDFASGLEGTVRCSGIDIEGGKGDLVVEFSARP